MWAWFFALAFAGKPLPASVIAGYTQGSSEEKISRAITEGGVNVVLWSFIKYVDGQIHIIENLNVGVLKKIQEKHPSVVHFAALGGWNVPHPSPVDDPDKFVSEFTKWNADKNFDGLDWDLEGADSKTAPSNIFPEPLLQFVCDTSKALQKTGILISIVPPQSYLDASSGVYDPSGSVLHPAPWKTDFTYHGQNAYAPMLLCMEPDIVIVQLYESYSRANHEYKDSPQYLVDLAHKYTTGWTVDFGGVMNTQKKLIKVSEKALGIGLATLAWTNDAKHFRPLAKDVLWPCTVRGFAYWSIKHETTPFTTDLARKCDPSLKSNGAPAAGPAPAPGGPTPASGGPTPAPGGPSPAPGGSTPEPGGPTPAPEDGGGIDNRIFIVFSIFAGIIVIGSVFFLIQNKTQTNDGPGVTVPQKAPRKRVKAGSSHRASSSHKSSRQPVRRPPKKRKRR